MKLRHFVPAAFVGALVLCAAGAAFWRPALFALAGVLALYAFAIAAASAHAWRRHGSRVFPGVPLAFVILHVAYGAGFWAGLLKFRGRWGRESRASRAASTFGNAVPR
jgi:hypothetical protein